MHAKPADLRLAGIDDWRPGTIDDPAVPKKKNAPLATDGASGAFTNVILDLLSLRPAQDRSCF